MALSRSRLWIQSSRGVAVADHRRLWCAAVACAIAGLGLEGRALAATDVWVGNTSNLWSNAANWNPAVVPATSGDSLQFGAAGTAGTTLVDDLMTPAAYTLNGITFTAAAPSYIINPASGTNNGFNLMNGITNSGTHAQTINDNIVFENTINLTTSAGGGDLILGGANSDNGGTISTVGNGQITLSGNNGFFGTINLNSGATLNLNNTGALGTAVLNINGGTLDNTSGRAITQAGANLIEFNGDFSFRGTNNLNLGNGQVLFTATSSTVTITVTAGTLTTTALNALGYGLTIAGGGTFNISNSANSFSSIGSDLTVNQGATLNITRPMTVGGNLNGGGVIQLGPSASATRILQLNGSIANFSGTLTNGGPNGLGVDFAMPGTVTLDSTNAARFAFTGGLSVGGQPSVSTAVVLNRNFAQAGPNAVGGTVNGLPNTLGAVYQRPGTVFTSSVGASTAAFQLGAGAGSYGYYQENGGTLTLNEIGVGGGNQPNAGAMGVLDITNGGVVASSGWITETRGTSQMGVINVNGGTLTGSTNDFGVNWGGSGQLAQVNIKNGLINSGPNQRIVPDEAAGSGLGTFNIGQGGNWIAQRFRAFGQTGVVSQLNFNGGTFTAAASNPVFGLVSNNLMVNAGSGVFVYSGGATFDNGGQNVQFSTAFAAGADTTMDGAPILAPTGNGVSSIALVDGGNGYIGPPIVTISGDGIGASAIANVDPATGKVTGITITNPGIGYTSATASVTGGTAGASASLGTVNVAPNVSGGVTFTGAGTMSILGGVHTYTGPTVVTGGGVLVLGGTTSSLNASSGITISGGATFVQNNSAVPVTIPVTVAAGKVSGSGTINSVLVNSSSANAVSNTATLSIGTLTLAGAATLNPVVTTGATGPAIAVTSLIANGSANSVALAITNPSFWTSGLYHLLTYSGTVGGTGISAINTTTPTFPGFKPTPRQTATIVSNPGSIDLQITGDNPTWTGNLNNQWTTATLSAPKNWALPGGVATDFINGDVVTFDDTGKNTSINITDPSGVATTLMIFNNSTVNYTIAAAGTVGITSGSLVKNGTGTLTLSSPNTYAGGTVINAGALIINNPTALGSGPLTLAAGTTIDNTATGTATVAGGGTIGGNLTFIGTHDLTINGAVSIPTNNTTLTLMGGNFNLNGNLTIGGAVVKDGAGTLGLGGTNVFPALVNVLNGALNITGGNTTFNLNAAPSLAAGFTANTQSVIIVSGGVVSTASEIWLGSDANSYGALEVNGGSISTGSWLALGRSNAGGGGMAGVGLVNVRSGLLNIRGANLTIGSFGATGGMGLVNVTGGSLTTTNGAGVFVGENFPGWMNVSGTGVVSVSTTNGNSITIGVNAAAQTGILNLGAVGAGGGTIITGQITNGGATGFFNFHGGTLQASRSNATFMQGVTNAFVYAEGAKIDDGGFNITVAQPLVPPAGGGVSSTGLTVSGGGFIDTPFVQVTGGDGTGASAVATVDTAGNLTGIVMTNPGTGYTTAPTFTLVGGGVNNTGTIGGSATIVANASTGGLTKSGTGTLTLTGASGYGGNTVISAGTLNFSGNVTHAIPTSAISGAGSLAVDSGTTLNSRGVVIGGSWTISGTQNITAGSGNSGTSKVNDAPAIAHTGSGTSSVFSATLNLADNALIVQTTSAADKATKIGALFAAVHAGSSGGTWTGSGITSSTAAADASHLGVGIFDNALVGKTTLGGQTVDSNSIFTAVAHIGDANRNGIVDIQDQSIVTNHWQSAQNTWSAGDLNLDGFVDLQDLTLVTNNWQASSPFSELPAAAPLGQVSAVPEPTAIGALGLGAMALILRRRRPRLGDRR